MLIHEIIKAEQPSIKQAFQQQLKWEINYDNSMKINRAVMNMMALDAEPFALVERQGFKELMKIALPKYTLPSRKYFSENLLPKMYEETKEKVSKLLTQATSASFTTDIWTSNNVTQSFISLTCHFIHAESLNQTMFTLATRSFQSQHSGLGKANS